MRDIDIAKSTLLAEDYTCVLCKGDVIKHSKLRGVKPLIDFYDSDHSFSDFSAADRVVGAGAAYLYVLLGVKTVWAAVISENAVNILRINGIEVTFENIVPAIINRSGDGLCPIEQAVKNVSSASQALEAIREKLKELNLIKI